MSVRSKGVLMQENWQFWVTSAIAFVALLNSIIARKEAKKASDIIKDSERRKELNQNYPPLTFKLELENDQARFAIQNKSPNRDTTLERVKFYVEIRVGRMRINEEYRIELDEQLNPNKNKYVPCDDFNGYLDKLRAVIFSESSEDVSIFVRAWLESKPAIYECEMVRENLEATISHDGSELILSRRTR